jgi:hypothetical protein
MSVSRCMHHAMAIAKQPRATWGEASERLPECCPNTDCTGDKGCRERVREYLRTQYRMQSRRDANRRGAVRT